jgi:hypothetical protein
VTAPAYHPGNIRALIADRWGVNTTPAFQRLPNALAAGVIQTIFKNDPSRVSLWIVNAGSNDCFVTPDPAHLAAFGTLTIAAHGGVLTADYAEDGEIVGYEWQALSNLGTFLFLVENILQATVAPTGAK